LLADSAVFVASLPAAWRRRLAIAAAAELWRSKLWSVLNPLFGNAFPFSREGAVRASMENCVSLLDEGWNVLIYPEGQLTFRRGIQPFKSGTGLLAVGANVEIVPVGFIVESEGWPRHVPFIRRGRVRLVFGRPLSFGAGDSYVEATDEIEDAVRSLGERGSIAV
jgi:long-chain acyl-CoA synthetase